MRQLQPEPEKDALNCKASSSISRRNHSDTLRSLILAGNPIAIGPNSPTESLDIFKRSEGMTVHLYGKSVGLFGKGVKGLG